MGMGKSEWRPVAVSQAGSVRRCACQAWLRKPKEAKARKREIYPWPKAEAAAAAVTAVLTMGRKAAAPPKEPPLEVLIERFVDATCSHGTADCLGYVEANDHLYWNFRRWCSRQRYKEVGVSAFGRGLSDFRFLRTKIGEGKVS